MSATKECPNRCRGNDRPMNCSMNYLPIFIFSAALTGLAGAAESSLAITEAMQNLSNNLMNLLRRRSLL
jgi:hypothetical protein